VTSWAGLTVCHIKTIDFMEIYNLDIIKNRTFLVLQGKCEDRLNNTMDAFMF
jgi:hypothetical protein